MWDFLVTLLMFPFKLALFLLEFLGRSLAITVGLAGFGVGALLCMFGPLILIGAPLALIGAILVVKAV